MKFSVVIPCYNEEASIKNVISSIPGGIDEIVVVDNNSKDRTAEIAKTQGATVIFEPKKGYGFALKAGFLHAKGDIIVTLDGDSQYPAEKILEMSNYLEEKRLDFLSGNRFPVKLSSMGIMRWVGNKIFNFIIICLFNLKFKDSQSGMWVFRKVILSHVTLENDDMALSEEIKIKVALHPLFKFEEYNIPYYPRIGRSKLLPLRHGVKNLSFLFKLKLNHARKSGHISFLDFL